jgi:MoxR-like ATPase
LKELQRAVFQIYVDPALISYAVNLATATRESSEYVAYGASPRGPISLVQAARALALIRGREYALAEDLQALAKDALRHRLVLTYQALAEEVAPDTILDDVIASVPVPQIDLTRVTAA